MTSLSSAYIRARQAAFLVKHAYLKLYLLEGEFQGERLRMLVADDGSTLPYISSMAFGDGADIHYKGKISAIKAPGLAASDADVVVVGANLLLGKLFRKRGFHLVPRWVYLTLDTQGQHPDEVIGRLPASHRADIRRNLNRMEKAGFTCEITTDQEWINLFYSRMYQPYAIKRHGKLSELVSYNEVKAVFEGGAGIVVKQDDKPVAGAVFRVKGTNMLNPYMGVLDGDDSIARAGASYALYYHSLLAAFHEGCNSVDYGCSRAFFSDGALRFKLKWGMYPVNDRLATRTFAVCAPRSTDAALRFLSVNSFFEMVDGKLQVYPDIPEANKPIGLSGSLLKEGVS